MNLENVLGSFTSKITDTVTAKAKDSVVTTLNDPEIRAVVRKFTNDWIQENKVIIIAVVGGCLLLSSLAIINIVADFSSKK